MRLLLMTVVLLILTGCVTATESDPFGAAVVERSKEQPPAWTALDAGVLLETKNLLKYVERQSQITNLPYGIKRTQTDGLEHSKLALRDRIMTNLLAVAEKGNLVTAPHPELDKYLLDVTDEIHREHAKVADIYFEKLRTTEPVGPKALTEYYRASVLIHFPKDRLQGLMTEIADRLMRSRDASLQALGRAVAETPTIEITH